jgi:hypothetical protein
VKAGPTFVTVKVDSRDVASYMESSNRSDADAAGAPGMVVMD